ncbi:MAG: LacI family transcriptional regulator [Ruminococcaceae bacterium]|nr:LacI family transcriptional regulator [Oscillospiraceae bacterium]
MTKIAKMAHVSVSTASKAFSMSEEVSEQTRLEVFRIAKEQGCFKKFYNARYPKHVVAVLCPEFNGRYYSAINSVLKEYLWQKSCEVCIAATDFSEEKEKELLEYYHDYSNVDGIIVIGGTITSQSQYEIPIVSMMPRGGKLGHLCLYSDLEQAMSQVVRHFVDAGVRQLGFLGELHTWKKQAAFCGELERRGLPEARVVVTKERFERGGYLGMEQLLAAGDCPRAVVCAYDHMAIGAMKCLADHGLSVPGDVAILGMDNIPEAEYLNVPLASVDFRIHEICAAATDAILALLDDKEVAKEVVFQARFLNRYSACVAGKYHQTAFPF